MNPSQSYEQRQAHRLWPLLTSRPLEARCQGYRRKPRDTLAALIRRNHQTVPIPWSQPRPLRGARRGRESPDYWPGLGRRTHRDCHHAGGCFHANRKRGLFFHSTGTNHWRGKKAIPHCQHRWLRVFTIGRMKHEVRGIDLVRKRWTANELPYSGSQGAATGTGVRPEFSSRPGHR